MRDIPDLFKIPRQSSNALLCPERQRRDVVIASGYGKLLSVIIGSVYAVDYINNRVDVFDGSAIFSVVCCLDHISSKTLCNGKL